MTAQQNYGHLIEKLQQRIQFLNRGQDTSNIDCWQHDWEYLQLYLADLKRTRFQMESFKKVEHRSAER